MPKNAGDPLDRTGKGPAGGAQYASASAIKVDSDGPVKHSLRENRWAQDVVGRGVDSGDEDGAWNRWRLRRSGPRKVPLGHVGQERVDRRGERTGSRHRCDPR